MPKIMLNGVDYSTPVASGVSGVKGNAESSYRTGNVNLTPANIGASPTSHASSATTYGISTASSYGHAMASTTTPKSNGTAAVGSETAKFARGDHVHPLQTSVTGSSGSCTGNAATATKATQDGNGNNIADTYAKKSIYNDTVLSVGRDGSSTKGTHSFAFGAGVVASGSYSQAAGGYTKATNNYSNAKGYYTEASNYASSICGKYSKHMTTGGDWNKQIGDVFAIGNGAGINSLSNAFRVTYTGAVYGLSAFNSSGADYAEFIKPWADGNPEDEDRVGYFVTVKEGLLYKANEGDYIYGITSGNPSIVGNADEDYYWRYERDDFNRIVMEDVPETVQMKDEEGNPVFDEETHEPVMVETGKMIPNARMKLAEGYDPSLQENYIERKDRKEWDYVGMLGVLPVRDDGTCLPDHFCKCGKNGIATFAKERGFDTYMVIERISSNVVSVILK